MPTNRPSYGLSLDKVLACCFVALMLVATKYLLKHRPSLVYKARETAARAMGTHTYPYPRPALTVDAVIVSKPAAGGQPKILLIQRKNPPCKVSILQLAVAERHVTAVNPAACRPMVVSKMIYMPPSKSGNRVFGTPGWHFTIS
eukprot:GHUV01008460.1.p1 GENE.GHUV01008460.1~~GHUV01008460.1.p1  ORF type:complete len:144 (+),score=7.32 GHUV01008460.1:345-776(+)